MRREILSSFCILPASLFHSFTRSVSFSLPLTSLSIFLPQSEPTQFPHPYLFMLLSFFLPSLSVLLLLLESFFTRLPPYFSLSFHFMVQRCLATLLQMFCTIHGLLSDVLFTARNNDIFIPVQKAATHEAISASIIQCIKKNGKIITENYLNNFRCS